MFEQHLGLGCHPVLRQIIPYKSLYFANSFAVHDKPCGYMGVQLLDLIASGPSLQYKVPYLLALIPMGSQLCANFALVFVLCFQFVCCASQCLPIHRY